MDKICYSHEGLGQTFKETYNRSKASRIPGCGFVRTIHLTLPLFLTPQVWQRHEYSIADIATTLEYFSVRHLWQCASLFSISVSNSAIRFNFDTHDCLTFTSKAVVIKKITKFLASEYVSNISVLEKSKAQHVPPIPLHLLCASEWGKLCSLLPSAMPSDFLVTLHYPGFYQWRHIAVVPLAQEGVDIYVVRIVAQAVYEESTRYKTHSIAHRPLVFCIDGNIYYGVDECCYFTQENPNCAS